MIMIPGICWSRFTDDNWQGARLPYNVPIVTIDQHAKSYHNRFKEPSISDEKYYKLGCRDHFLHRQPHRYY